MFACVSEGVAEEVREHYPRLAPRVIAIHNGVDLERFEPGRWREQAREQRERLGIGEHQLVALFVGGEWERKGLRPVVEALADAPEWMLAVAGPGDRAHFEQLARSLGVHERIRWLGVQREVAPLYAMADAFVLPTSYETFSLATFEAAASGLPLLATPVNGIRELLEPGVNGFFIDRRPRPSPGPWASSRPTARGCSRWAARRAGPRCASAGRTRSSATTSCTAGCRAAGAEPSPERSAGGRPRAVAGCGIAAPLLAEIQGRPDTL